MKMIEAKVICDSIGEHSPRLTTFLTRYPKFIHAEHMRHRTGSYCVSSSRAIPVAKNLEEVRSDELRASPVWWGKEQKGMQSGEELSLVDELRLFEFVEVGGTIIGKATTPQEHARLLWKKAALESAYTAQCLYSAGAHKSIVNRLLEPFLHVNCLMTICEPGLMNFFGLRLDKAAQPEMRVLAEQMWKVWNESTPKKLEPGQWHLPFIDYDDIMGHVVPQLPMTGEGVETNSERVARKVSVARCARLSYLSFETGKRSTVEEDLALYQRLVGAHPIHASPAEHQATPDTAIMYNKEEVYKWDQWWLHGNLPGWIQFRKTLPDEVVAELPEAYR